MNHIDSESAAAAYDRIARTEEVTGADVHTADAAGFILRPAAYSDIKGIMAVMEEAASSGNPEWFIADDEDYIREHIDHNGFTITAFSETSQEVAGFFVVKYPGLQEWHPGKEIAQLTAANDEIAVMDSAAVLKKYRGNHLQSLMLSECEYRAQQNKRKILVCTIHPDNIYSRHNMESNGYQVMNRAICYGDKDRLILMKSL